MGFIGKYPLKVLVGLTYPKRSNRVLKNLNIINLSSSRIVSAQASVLATEISQKSDLNECSIEYQSQLSHYFLMAKLLN